MMDSAPASRRRSSALRPGGRWRAVARAATMPGFYTLFTLGVFWRVWTPIDGAQRTWRYDPPNEYWGDLIFLHRTLQEGDVAMWNPHDRLGFPVYGDPQPGLLYPINWLFLLLAGCLGGVPYALIVLKVLAHWVWGAVGAHLVMRYWVRTRGPPDQRVPEAPAYLAGVLFGWSGPQIRYGGSTLNWSFAWIPWLFLALLWFCDRPGPRRGIVLGSALSMVLLAGSAAVTVFALVITAPVALYLLRGKLRVAAAGMAAAALTVLAWLVQLVACNLEQLPESVRSARDLDFIGGTGFTMAHIGSFLVPGLGGESVYCGLYALLCVGVSLRCERRSLVVILVGVGALGVALALGSHSGFLPSLASSVPIFGLFRRAHRYLYMTSFVMALLAGIGVMHLLCLPESQRRAVARAVTWIGGALSFAFLLAYVVTLAQTEAVFSQRAVSFGHATLAAGLSTWLLRWAVVGPRARRLRAVWLAVALVACDLWLANAALIEAGMTGLPATSRDNRVPAAAASGDTAVYDRQWLGFRPGTRLGIRDFGGYERDPLRLERYEKMRLAAQRNPKILGHVNVGTLLTLGRAREHLQTSSGLRSTGTGRFEIERVAPRVFFIASPRVVASADEALRVLSLLNPGTQAVVEAVGGFDVAEEPRGQGRSEASEREVIAGRVVDEEPDEIGVEISTPSSGWVVVADAYFSGWRATVNGEAAVIHPANVLARAVKVPAAGTHHIRMRLHSGRFWALLPTYVLAWILLVLALVGRPRRWLRSW